MASAFATADAAALELVAADFVGSRARRRHRRHRIGRNMTWVPNSRELALLAEFSLAGLSAKEAARRLNVSVDDLRAFARRLEMGRSGVVAPEPPAAADSTLSMRDGRVFR